MEDFLVALKSAEWKAEIPVNKRDILLARAKESKVDAITFQDFVNVVSIPVLIFFFLFFSSRSKHRHFLVFIRKSQNVR